MTQRLPLLAQPAEVHTFLETAKSSNPGYPICIVDLSSPQSYAQGHIKDAVSIPIHILMNGAPPAAGKIPTENQLTRLFSYLGTQPDTHFIVYDDEGGGWAGRFVWTLDVIGHKHVSVIDGGLIAWQNENLPLTDEPTSPEPVNYPVKIDQSQIVTTDYILENLECSNFAIWDARSRAEYAGVSRFAAHAGHIPGAINLEWTALMDPARSYKVRTDARQQLEKLGITQNKTVITHCQSHHRSGYTYLVGKYLGLNILGYDGSWSEWGNTPDLPVSKTMK